MHIGQGNDGEIDRERQREKERELTCSTTNMVKSKFCFCRKSSKLLSNMRRCECLFLNGMMMATFHLASQSVGLQWPPGAISWCFFRRYWSSTSFSWRWRGQPEIEGAGRCLLTSDTEQLIYCKTEVGRKSTMSTSETNALQRSHLWRCCSDLSADLCFS